MSVQRVLFASCSRSGQPPGARAIYSERRLLDLGGKRMTDPEFDHVGYQVTWQDENENLWVAPVDPLNGDLNMNAAEMIDTGLAPNAPIRSGIATGNGPEWVYTAKGSMILYTVQDGSAGKHNWRIALARKVPRRTGMLWTAQLLNGPEGLIGGPPEGTKVPGDSDPLFLY